MVHPAVLGAATAGASNARSSVRPRQVSRGSFHAGDIFPSFNTADGGNTGGGSSSSSGRRRHGATRGTTNATLGRRSSVGTKYHTFPAPPPDGSQNEGDSEDGQGQRQPRRLSPPNGDRGEDDHPHHRRHRRDATPLPIRQLGLLALLSLAEQTALNSIGPYLPTMVGSFPEIPASEMGLYVGVLASTFALAQLATNLFWGYLSDVIGRKPVMLLGSFLLMLCFGAFGFCTHYWQVVVVHVAMGLLNGNAAVVPTCLGEVTDRTNQSSAFTWLPVVYSLGSITGPALGGLLAGVPDGAGYPFLAPNIGSAVLLGFAVVVLGLWFDETLDRRDRRALPAGLVWIDDLWTWVCCLTTPSSSEPSTPSTEEESTPASASTLTLSGDSESSPLLGSRISEDETRNGDIGNDDDDDDEDDDEDDDHTKTPFSRKTSALRQLLNHKTVLLLLTYLVFQLANISFNSLYPIFSAAPPPTGRNLPPGMIGLLLSFAGFATILFQVTVFQTLKAKMGNLGTYRFALFGLALSMMLMPWTSGSGGNTKKEKEWRLFGEIGAVLVFKNICAVGGLSSVMLLINNSAPSHETLGTLNGIAQSLSAAGRSVGPVLSGALFSLSTRIRRPNRGELLAWCVFGGVAALGWLLSLVINGRGLESADWEGTHEEADREGDEEEGHYDEDDE